MRVAAGLVILLVCTLWGCRRSILLKRRCALISGLRLLVEHYSIEISCTAPTLDELAALGAFGLAVALDLSVFEQDADVSARGGDAGPLEELVELDGVGINGDFLCFHDALLCFEKSIVVLFYYFNMYFLLQ